MTREITDNVILFRLYVAGSAPNSVLARSNLKLLCEARLGSDGYELEIVDVLEQPERALDDNVIVTPTLVRLAPQPVLHITGNLSNTELVLSMLGIETGDG